MERVKIPDRQTKGILMALLFCLGMVLVASNSSRAVTLEVVGVDNTVSPSVETVILPDINESTGYRWLVEWDRTYHVPRDIEGEVLMNGSQPATDPDWINTLSVGFHRSYMPVVAEGRDTDQLPVNCTEAINAEPCLDSSKNYFISILPDSGYSIGGAPLKAGETEVIVYVNKHPIPTAQITIFVHEDIAPINGVWDEGEPGLEGFGIILEDAGGKYGASAGIQSADVYGNPLCTTYKKNMTVAKLGAGCVTGPDGRVTIKNLAPGKYGVITVPPNAEELPPGSNNWVSTNWSQTSTIEGTKLIDAWVKANEPPFFGEFGPPGPHVSVGYVPAGPDVPYVDDTELTGGTTIQGQVVNLHLSRPPDSVFWAGGPFPHTTPWVGLNLGAAGLGKGVFAIRTGPEGEFSIPGVPPGDYQLVVWDDNLDIVFAKNTVRIDANGNCNGLTGCELGFVPVFQWFTRMEHYVFGDLNENGFWDDGESGFLEQNVNLRWRDGTIYQAFATDSEGAAPFDQVFPFFAWLVAEVDFARYKATGATVVVDDGGSVLDWNDPWTFGGALNPQPQINPLTDDCKDPDGNWDPVLCNDTYRTELGPVLTQAFQGFLGQTSVIEWGKAAYHPADLDNYPTDNFPGVEDLDHNNNGVFDLAENGGISGMVMYAVTRAEDDPRWAAAEPWEAGIPNVQVNLYDSTGSTLLATTFTDSWDASLPANCQYGANAGSGTDDPFTFRGVDTDCYDGMRNWNQVRPGVFDGGYAFTECELVETGECVEMNTGGTLGPLPAGQYVVEVVPPQGYKIIRSQDRNVDFGDEYAPSPLAEPPFCVGVEEAVPATLTLFPGVVAPLAGQILPLCDRKLANLSDSTNAAVDFFLFTEVPIAGHIIGFILDDTANEFDQNSPQFGEKYAPPFLPVSIRDWTGREISRTYSDEYGRYNAMVPSTLTQNLSQPSGISPNMLTTCMNAKYKTDGTPDPLHNPQYSQFCYTFQYMPGSTTHLDTPVVPVAAFAGPDQNPLDCEYIDGTPRIHSVSAPNNGVGGGPYLPTDKAGIIIDGTIEIQSMGTVAVPNPAYLGVGSETEKTVERDFGFGCPDLPTVTLGGVDVQVTCTDPNNTDAPEVLIGTVTGVSEGVHQLVVERANGKSTITGVTVQVGLRDKAKVVTVSPPDTQGQMPGPIQTAIDNAGTNDLILLKPGVYDELVIMWKPVQLQGWGEGSTEIDATKTPFEKLIAWREHAKWLLDTNKVDLVDGQQLGFGTIEPATTFGEEGPGVIVVAKSSGKNRFSLEQNRGARIDGLTITGADTGGGLFVNGFAHYLELSNLRVENNTAFFTGGIRAGHPILSVEQNDGLVYSDAHNDHLKIHHNTVTRNGGLAGAGGGISMHTGTDSYEVTDNFVCGNFTTADGAGIAHYGLSHQADGIGPIPLIGNNTIIFNENFNQGRTTNGGGVLVAGATPLIGTGGSPGSGSVQIVANLIKGNSAGAGDGGGIRLSRVNGVDAGQYTVDIINNMIVNNVAALSGGGISLQDAINVNILHNTIANNDNTSTAGEAFAPGLPSESMPQPGAGVVSRAHSPELAALVDAGFSNPTMENNIIWHNRMFYWLLDETNPDNVLTGLCPDVSGVLNCGTAPVYSDLAVLGTGNTEDVLDCTSCLMDSEPLFVAEYVNGNRQTTSALIELKTAIAAPPALDEGGNFIRLRYGPLTQTDTHPSAKNALLGDYHITGDSPAVDAGLGVGVVDDIDGDLRPLDVENDYGADEVKLP